jgi:hypothetical protein
MDTTTKQVLMGLATTVVVFLVGRKAYAIYSSKRRTGAQDNLPAPPCTYHQATLIGGPRDMSTVKWIVLHATDGGTTAEGIGNYFASPLTDVTLPDGRVVKQPGGSSNVVVGDDGCVQSVPDDRIPAGAPPLNEQGWHIEFVGQSKWTREEWFAHMPTLENGRRKIRDFARAQGIPRVILGVDELRGMDVPGVVTHATVTNAFHKSDHLDPGPGFPIDYVLGDGS